MNAAALTVHVGVHQVRVHDVGAKRADLRDQGRDQDRIHVGAGGSHRDVDACRAQFLHEEVTAPRPQHAHSDVDAHCGERRQEEEEVSFGSSDALDALDVQDPHAISWQACPLPRVARGHVAMQG